MLITISGDTKEIDVLIRCFASKMPTSTMINDSRSKININIPRDSCHILELADFLSKYAR